MYGVVGVLGCVVVVVTLAAVGGNDVANSQATAVGTGAISFRSAMILAGVCECLGATLIGGTVSSTLGDKIIEHDNMYDSTYVLGMFAVLIATCGWLIIATIISMLVSSTHSVIGALIGFGVIITNGKFDHIDWCVHFLCA